MKVVFFTSIQTTTQALGIAIRSVESHIVYQDLQDFINQKGSQAGVAPNVILIYASGVPKPTDLLKCSLAGRTDIF